MNSVTQNESLQVIVLLLIKASCEDHLKRSAWLLYLRVTCHFMTHSDSMNFELFDSGYLVRIEPVSLVSPGSELDWDRNWVQCLVTVKGSTFSGQFRADFMTTDFELFKRQLKVLYTDLNGTATFKPLEEQLTLDIKGDGLGHFEADCVATPQPHTGESLSLSFSFDQTSLPSLINQLDRITKAFPIDGDFLIKNE